MATTEYCDLITIIGIIQAYVQAVNPLAMTDGAISGVLAWAPRLSTEPSVPRGEPLAGSEVGIG